MEETTKIYKNNNEYILADDAMINEKHIYHFISTKMIDFFMNDELCISVTEDMVPVFSLFCKKENDNYIEIEDKNEIKNLLLEFGMLPERILASVVEMFIGVAGLSAINVSSSIIYNQL